MEPILSYLYKDKHYYSKFAACEAALLDGLTVNELVDNIKAMLYKKPNYFIDYDFTVEPKQDWLEMCVERAHELRQKHKYLALAFSGGSDSAFVLDIFLKNNIYLDEIYTVLGDPFKDKNLPLDMDGGFWEVNFHAIPYMKYIKKEYDLKYTKFTVQDNFEDSINGHFNESLLQSSHHGIFFTPTGNTHWQVIQDYKAQDKFIINGAFETNIGFDSRYFMEMWDTDNAAQVCHWNYIPFFCPEDNPKMHAKQCHLVMKHFKQHGFKHRKKDWVEYHKAQISATRNWLYNFCDSPYFQLNTKSKTKDRRAAIFSNSKTRAFIKALRHLKVDNWMDSLNKFYFKPTIKNIHLYDLPTGFSIAKQYLE